MGFSPFGGKLTEQKGFAGMEKEFLYGWWRFALIFVPLGAQEGFPLEPLPPSPLHSKGAP